MKTHSALAHERYRSLFVNDPRAPLTAILTHLNQAAQALKENRRTLGKEYIRQALEVLEKGVSRGYYTRGSIEPLKGEILVRVPADMWLVNIQG